MSSPTELTTERLRLRQWLPTEADRVLDIRGRREVAQWLSDPEPWTDLRTARDWIRSAAERTAGDDPLGVWAIVPHSTGVPAGSVSLGLLPGSTEVEIGWHLHPDSTGRGYAREAAAALLDHALRSGVATVWAIMWPHNEASARVASSIGMVDLGVRDDPWYGTEAEPTSRIFRIDAEGSDPGGR